MSSIVLMSDLTKVASWVVWCSHNLLDLDGSVYICTPVGVLGHDQRSSIVSASSIADVDTEIEVARRFIRCVEAGRIWRTFRSRHNVKCRYGSTRERFNVRCPTTNESSCLANSSERGAS
jgi:hypothetical protein